MSLLPYDPFQSFERLKQELEHLFPTPSFSPIKIREMDQQIIATCRMPGVKRREDFTVYVHGNLLTVSRKVNSSYEVKSHAWYSSQQFAGATQQTVPLPSPVHAHRMTTRYNQDTLEIILPKRLPSES
ncbi:Hsp20/alpha crystallin family protein [Ammoniphilus sp. CFH 90114]|uniref:Hsp20/alpha crystallin family protein n=1 Tax=Ammoniphilus sp. CFH 90114 TaxID=2493665 RepID=UPI00101003FD|nr:Hsp20/alpha crystallin family protein [Ammoniphilus sp. CFH 90114]RXT02312.1 Hsp20/alpha crystallin family protein [Ammoniphilus sp. CFH 90114]